MFCGSVVEEAPWLCRPESRRLGLRANHGAAADGGNPEIQSLKCKVKFAAHRQNVKPFGSRKEWPALR